MEKDDLEIKDMKQAPDAPPLDAPELTMSSEAIRHALELQSENPAWQGLALRLYLDGKGCDGFYYGISFDQALPQDLHFLQDTGVDLIVDPDTLPFVSGSEIIWIDDERGKGFLVENPEHKRYRGKFYKRRDWLKKLAEKKPLAAEGVLD